MEIIMPDDAASAVIERRTFDMADLSAQMQISTDAQGRHWDADGVEHTLDGDGGVFTPIEASRERRRVEQLASLRAVLDDAAQAEQSARLAARMVRGQRGQARAEKFTLRHVWAVRHAPDVEVAAAVRGVVGIHLRAEEINAGLMGSLEVNIEAQLRAWRVRRPRKSVQSARHAAETAALRYLAAVVAWYGTDEAVAAAGRLVAGELFPGVEAMAGLLAEAPAWAPRSLPQDDGSVCHLRYPAAEEAFGTDEDGRVVPLPVRLERVDRVTGVDGTGAPVLVEGVPVVVAGPLTLTLDEAVKFAETVTEVVGAAASAGEVPAGPAATAADAMIAVQLRSCAMVMAEQAADDSGFVEVGPSLFGDALRWMNEAAARLEGGQR